MTEKDKNRVKNSAAIRVLVSALMVISSSGCSSITDKGHLSNLEIDNHLDDVVNSAEQASWSEVTRLKFQIIADFVSEQQQAAASGSQTLADKAALYLRQQNADGSWSDIDYEDRARADDWEPLNHLLRLNTLAADFYQKLSADPDDSSLALLGRHIRKGLDFWYQVKPESNNWWWQEIGKQMYLGPISLMAESVLPEPLRAKIIIDFPAVPYGDGANLTDLSKAAIYGGLLSGDHKRIAAGIAGIKTSVVISLEQGIQADNSFHQHGPQLYNGAYGKVFFNTAIYWAYQVRDLQWAFSVAKTDILSAYFLDGDRWMTRGSIIDYSTAGRSITRSKTKFSSKALLLKQLDYVAALTPQRKDETVAFRKHILGAGSGLNGHKHFWRSDYAVNMRDDYLFSVHMASDRVYTTESGNGENLLGYWLGFGNTFLRLRGDEYQDIFPVWDWKYIPGVTSPAYQGKGAGWAETLHHSSFVGGVSDGQYGVTTMDMNAMETTAKKSWFHFDNEIVALGAGITSASDKNVHTTVNQVLLQGAVTVDGRVLKQGRGDLTDVSWVHHDNVGYVFGQAWHGYLSNGTQTGSWQRINNSQSDKQVSKEVFLLRIAHGHQPKNDHYQYIMLPGETAAQTQQYSESPQVTVLKNTRQVQAVTHHKLQRTGIVFHQQGSVAISSGLTVSVDKASIVLIDLSKSIPVVSIAIPDALNTQVKVTLSFGNGKSLTQTIAMPTEISQLGKTVTRVFNQ